MVAFFFAMWERGAALVQVGTEWNGYEVVSIRQFILFLHSRWVSVGIS